MLQARSSPGGSSGAKSSSLVDKLKPTVQERTMTFLPAKKQDTLPATSSTPANGNDGAVTLKKLKWSSVINAARNANSAEDVGDSSGLLAPPKLQLFATNQLPTLMRWPAPARVGGGLNNLGNTCFLNSVVQCLTYTPPLANFCKEKRHSSNCRAGQHCVFCRFEEHVQFVGTVRSACTPTKIVQLLRVVAKHMQVGRQEDAHEFLRYFVEALQKSSIAGIPKERFKPDEYRRVCETTFIHQIFGGHLRSQVKCAACGHESNTVDPFLDLSLEITNCQTLEDCLAKFTARELLDPQNLYKCEKCSMKTRASKRLTIHTSPYILSVQFKRFKSGGFLGGNKITRQIAYKETLRLAPYMSHPESAAARANYHLYGVIVHQGNSTRSGHYYAFVKAANGGWHELNDDIVSAVSASTALSQQAYILFYAREVSPTSAINPLALPTVTNNVRIPAAVVEKGIKLKAAIERAKSTTTTTTTAPAENGHKVESKPDHTPPEASLLQAKKKKKHLEALKFFRAPQGTGTNNNEEDNDNADDDDDVNENDNHDHTKVVAKSAIVEAEGARGHANGRAGATREDKHGTSARKQRVEQLEGGKPREQSERDGGRTGLLERKEGRSGATGRGEGSERATGAVVARKQVPGRDEGRTSSDGTGRAGSNEGRTNSLAKHDGATRAGSNEGRTSSDGTARAGSNEGRTNSFNSATRAGNKREHDASEERGVLEETAPREASYRHVDAEGREAGESRVVHASANRGQAQPGSNSRRVCQDESDEDQGAEERSTGKRTKREDSSRGHRDSTSRATVKHTDGSTQGGRERVIGRSCPQAGKSIRSADHSRGSLDQVQEGAGVRSSGASARAKHSAIEATDQAAATCVSGSSRRAAATEEDGDGESPGGKAKTQTAAQIGSITERIQRSDAEGRRRAPGGRGQGASGADTDGGGEKESRRGAEEGGRGVEERGREDEDQEGAETFAGQSVSPAGERRRSSTDRYAPSNAQTPTMNGDGKRHKNERLLDFSTLAATWAHEARVTQFGTNVDAWETVSQDVKEAQARMLRAPEMLPERAFRDEWDIEYDKGKVKKVKDKNKVPNARHGFDRFYQNRKKFLSPGKRMHKNVKSGRPFKRFNKPFSKKKFD